MTMTATESADANPFADLPGEDPDVLARLHARLVEDARRDGVLDVAYRTLDTPAGQLLLAATDQGLVRVAYAVQDHEAVCLAAQHFRCLLDVRGEPANPFHRGIPSHQR